MNMTLSFWTATFDSAEHLVYPTKLRDIFVKLKKQSDLMLRLPGFEVCVCVCVCCACACVYMCNLCMHVHVLSNSMYIHVHVPDVYMYINNILRVTQCT